MPDGELVTVPDPVPDLKTLKMYCPELSVNFAVTFLAALIVTVHVIPVPEHAPDQTVKALPSCGTAVKVTEVPTS